MTTGAEIERTENRGHANEASVTALMFPSCLRCGGLMVGEYSIDLLNGTGELECLATRCVQCGEIVDPVILRNQRAQQECFGRAGRRQVVQLGASR